MRPIRATSRILRQFRTRVTVMIGVLGRRTTNLSVDEQSCEAGTVPGPTFRIRPEIDYPFASNELPSCCAARNRASRYESVITPSKLGALSTFLPKNRPEERRIIHVRPPIVKWVSFLSSGTDDSRTRDSQNWRSGLPALAAQGRHRARYHGVLDRDVKSPAEEEAV